MPVHENSLINRCWLVVIILSICDHTSGRHDSPFGINVDQYRQSNHHKLGIKNAKLDESVTFNPTINYISEADNLESLDELITKLNISNLNDHIFTYHHICQQRLRNIALEEEQTNENLEQVCAPLLDERHKIIEKLRLVEQECGDKHHQTRQHFMFPRPGNEDIDDDDIDIGVYDPIDHEIRKRRQADTKTDVVKDHITHHDEYNVSVKFQRRSTRDIEAKSQNFNNMKRRDRLLIYTMDAIENLYMGLTNYIFFDRRINKAAFFTAFYPHIDMFDLRRAMAAYVTKKYDTVAIPYEDFDSPKFPFTKDDIKALEQTYRAVLQVILRHAILLEGSGQVDQRAETMLGNIFPVKRLTFSFIERYAELAEEDRIQQTYKIPQQISTTTIKIDSDNDMIMTSTIVPDIINGDMTSTTTIINNGDGEERTNITINNAIIGEDIKNVNETENEIIMTSTTPITITPSKETKSKEENVHEVPRKIHPRIFFNGSQLEHECKMPKTINPNKNGKYMAGSVGFMHKVRLVDDDNEQLPANFSSFYVPMAISSASILDLTMFYASYTPFGYVGYQPNGYDEEGNYRLRLIFSTFASNSTTEDHTMCSDGSDGYNEGVSCEVDYSPIEYDRLYYIHVKRIEDQRYIGYFIDPYRRKKRKIGELTYGGKECQGIMDNHGFLETFRYNNFDSCCGLWPQQILSMGIFSDDFGGAHTIDSEYYEYGSSCTGDAANMQVSKTTFTMTTPKGRQISNTGLYITRGFKHPTNKWVDNIEAGLI